MIVAETVGMASFNQRVKIYATDVDEDALSQARAAMYSHKAAESIPPPLLEKYFVPNGSNYHFNKDLRRAVVFGRHDLVQYAPIPRVDILACRNALMYFNVEMQKRILERLRFALNPRGILLLGKAEMLLTQSDLFTPVDLKRRLFVRATKGSRRMRGSHAELPSVALGPSDDVRKHLQQAALDSTRIAQLVIDGAGNIALINTRAAQVFGLSPATTIGQPFRDHDVSYRPVELRSCIEKVRNERRTIEIMWGVRDDEVLGRPFLELDIVLPVNDLRAARGSCVATSEESELALECTNRRGRPLSVRAWVVPLRRPGQRGVVVVVEEVRPA